MFLVAYIVFYAGISVADPEETISIIHWYSVIVAFAIPALLGFLIGVNLKEDKTD